MLVFLWIILGFIAAIFFAWLIFYRHERAVPTRPRLKSREVEKDHQSVPEKPE